MVNLRGPNSMRVEPRKPMREIRPNAMALLFEYEWPGNVRQLEHAMEMAAALSGDRETIYLGDIEVHLQAGPRDLGAVSSDADQFALDVSTDDLPFEDLMGKVEKLLLEQALRRHGGNKARAAKALGLKRTTLQSRIQKLGIDRST